MNVRKEFINGEEREFEIRITPSGKEVKVYTDVLKRLFAKQEKDWQELKQSLMS